MDTGGNLVPPEAGTQLTRRRSLRPARRDSSAGISTGACLFSRSITHSTPSAPSPMLSEEGFIVLARTHAVRYAIERTEANGTPLDEEYDSTSDYRYRDASHEQVIADLLGTFSAARLWSKTSDEPQLSADAGDRYPYKREGRTPVWQPDLKAPSALLRNGTKISCYIAASDSKRRLKSAGIT